MSYQNPELRTLCRLLRSPDHQPQPWAAWLDFHARDVWLGKLSRAAAVRVLEAHARHPSSPCVTHVETRLTMRVEQYQRDYDRVENIVAREIDRALDAGHTGAQMREMVHRVSRMAGFGDVSFDHIFRERVRIRAWRARNSSRIG